MKLNRFRDVFPRPVLKALLPIALALFATNLFAQITTNPPPPVIVKAQAADAIATEPCNSSAIDNAVFVLSRDSQTNIDLRVYVAWGGSATNGVDYMLRTNEFLIPNGRWAIEIPIVPKADTLPENLESVVMRIMPVACIAIYPPPPECYQVGIPAAAEAHIVDCGVTNPPPTLVSVRAADARASEPCLVAVVDTGLFVITRDSNTNIDLKVNVALGGTASNGVDYTEIPREILIPKGRWATEIRVNALMDKLTEGPERVVMRILPPFCPQTVVPLPPECYRMGASEAVVEIADCQVPQDTVLTIRAADPYATEPCSSAQSDPGVFVLSRNANTNVAIPVRLEISGTASNGVDYVQITNVIWFPVGKHAIELPIKPIYDNLSEGPENVVVRILQPFCATLAWPPPPECYLVGQPAEAAVFIRECLTNRPPIVHITHPTNGQAFAAPARIGIRAETRDPDGYCWKAEFFNGNIKIGERTKAFLVAPTNGSMIPFEFVWTNVPAGLYTLSVRATDSQGIVGMSQPVKVAVGQPPITNRPAEVSIVAVQPMAIEGTNCWSWSSVTNRFAESTAQTPTYSVAQNSLVWWFTNCGPRNATFVIRRSGPTNDSLRVFYRISGTATNGVDYESLPESVVIPAGARKAEVLVVPREDSVPEPVETVVLGLMLPPFASPLPAPYIIVPPARAAAVIVDSSNPRLPTGVLPDRSFYVGGNAPDGSWFRIERSRDTKKWEVVCTNQVSQGAVHFVDPDAVELPRLFYRAVPTSPPAED